MQVGLGHRHAELIASETTTNVRRSNDALELLCDQAQRVIACPMSVPVVDLLQVVDVDHHHGEVATVALGQRDLTLHHALELAPVGEPCEVIGARLVRELPGTVDRDRDLVGDGRHQQQVRGSKDAITLRAGRHHADGAPTDTELGAQRVPTVAARDSLDARLRAPHRRNCGPHVRPCMFDVCIDLVSLKSDGVREPVDGTFPEPDRAGIQTECGQRLGQRHLCGLADVQRPAHDGCDRGQPVEVALAVAVLLVEVVKVPAGHARRQPLDDILDAALSQGQYLIAKQLALERKRQKLDRRAAIHRQHVNERLERHALRGAKAAVIARALLVLDPGRLRLLAQ